MSELTLAIDASTAQVSVAILDGDNVMAATNRPTTKGESGNLLADISKLAEACDITFDTIACLAVGVGPGNFTGLRLSAAITQALALPTKTPVFGICSAEAIAMAIKRQRGNAPVVIIGDARRERIWLLEYESNDPAELCPQPVVVPIAEAAPLLQKPGLMIATPDWNRIGNALETISPSSATLIQEDTLPDASDIGRLALSRHRQGDSGGNIDPIYVHPPVFIEPRFQLQT